MIFFLSKRRHQRLMKRSTAAGIKRRLMRTVCGFAILCATHIGCMSAFENMSVNDAAWLTATTATTVGYGDLSAETIPGRLSTAVLMYGGGIAALTSLVSLTMEAAQLKKSTILDGKWRWKMDNHMVILNSPKNNPEAYFKSLMTDFRKSALPDAQLPAIIATPHMEELPEDIRKLNVAHVNEPLSSKEAFNNASVKDASIIVVLSHDEADPASDSITLDLVERARTANPNARIIAESILDDNIERMKKNGADQVMRPMRSYPEMLSRAVLSPGSEQLVHELLDSHGEECVRYDVPVRGQWASVARRIMNADIGLPLGYVDMDGNNVTGVNPNEDIEAKAIFALVRDDNHKTPKEVGKILSKIKPQTVQPRRLG
jgi:voltage-gated potassium channel